MAIPCRSRASIPRSRAGSRRPSETLGEPTEVQREGWAAIRRGEHALLSAPTGSGKTLAAFLSALNALLSEPELAGVTRRRGTSRGDAAAAKRLRSTSVAVASARRDEATIGSMQDHSLRVR